MTLFDSKTAKILFTASAFAVGLALIYVLRVSLLVFLFAVFFAYLMEPVVNRLALLLRGRGRSIAVLYILLIALIVTFFVFVGPQVGREAGRMGAALPKLLDQVSSGEIVKQIGNDRGWSRKTQQGIQSFLHDHQADIQNILSRVGFRVAEAAQNVGWILLVPIFSIFMLYDGKAFSTALLRNIRQDSTRVLVEGVLRDMDDMLAHFMRSQLLMALLSLIVYTTGLSLMGMPYALVLGVAGGVLEFVPVVGPWTSIFAMLLVAYLTGDPPLVWLIPFLAVWRLVMDYVVLPKVMGQRLQLHPLALLFGLLAGGELAGVLGVFLSVPVMASLRIVWRRWRIYSDGRLAAQQAFDDVMSD